MRVALFIDTEQFAGTESHVLELALGLQRKNIGTHVICSLLSPLTSKVSAAGVTIIPFKKRGLVDWQTILMLCHTIRSEKVDIIHVHNGTTALLASIALAVAKRGCCVMTQHFVEPAHITLKGPRALLHRLAHRWVNRRINHFIAISEAVRQQMLERGDSATDRISVIPNGITIPDLQILTPASKIREELNIGADLPLIVCVARLEREKDLASLITAMEKVVAINPAARCVVAGEGSKKSELLERIRQANLEGVVRLLGFRTDALSWINAGDIFVLPSLAEPFGLVILEAMALGKPVVATRAGGPLEIVVDGETGLFVPPSDPEALAQAIICLLKDPQSRERMGQKGRQRFLQKYTADRMVEATLAVYKKVMKE